VLLGEPGVKSPHKALYYEVDGIRRDNWKLVMGKRKKPELYNLLKDIGEKNDLASKHPDIVQQLKSMLDAHAEQIIEDTRPSAFVEQATPIISQPGKLPRLRHYMDLLRGQQK